MGFFDNVVPQVQESRARTGVHQDLMATISSVRDLTAQVKKTAQDLEDGLLVHEGYHLAASAVSEAQKGKKEARAAVMADNPDLYDKSTQLKKLRADLNTVRGKLSDLLLEYERESGQTSLETDDGVLVSIRKTASVQMKLF